MLYNTDEKVCMIGSPAPPLHLLVTQDSQSCAMTTRYIFHLQERWGSVTHPCPRLSTPPPLQINPLNQLPTPMMMCLPMLPAPTLSTLLHLIIVATLIRPLPPHIHSIIRTLREPVALLPIMGDDGAVDGAGVVFGNASDDDAVGAGGTAVVGPGGLDGELEVWLLGVREGEVFVVVVGVWVWGSWELVGGRRGGGEMMRWGGGWSHLSLPRVLPWDASCRASVAAALMADLLYDVPSQLQPVGS